MSYLEKHAELKDVKLDDGQEQIVKQLESLVNDTAMNVIGLEGEWGSGKSTILKALKEKNKEKYCCCEYDLWAHQEDNIRYSFLKGLLECFKPKEKTEKKYGFFYHLFAKPAKNKGSEESKEEIKDLKKLEEEVETLISTRKESSPRINFGMAGVISVMLLLPILANVADKLWGEMKLVYLIASICIPIAIVSFLYLCSLIKEEKFIPWKILLIIVVGIIMLGSTFFNIVISLDGGEGGIISRLQGLITNGAILKIIFAIQIFFVVVFIAWVALRFRTIARKPFVLEALSIYNEKFVETSYSIDIQPRMEDVEKFLKKFFNYIAKEEGNKKFVIAFDNLDRLPPNKIREFWTFLQTFFVGKSYDSVTTIVAFEREAVKKAWKDGVGTAYIEKSLDLIMYVPLLSRMDLKGVFKDLWRQAFNGSYDRNGENVFILYHLLKKEEKDFPSLRGIIDAINEVISVKEKIDKFFPDKKVQGRIAGETVDIKNSIELAAMYVFKKNCINKMFSDTVKTGIVQYYIDAFDDYRGWVEQYVPEVDDDGKKMCLQRIYNRIIQNNNESANNMNSYYIIDFFYKGRLEYFFNGSKDNDELKSDFEYIFATAFQRINDNGKDMLNAIKSLLYCQKGKVCSSRNLGIKWGLLFKKMELLKAWPKEAWYWNVLFYYGKDYLNEFTWTNGVVIADSKENFLIDKLKDYFFKEKKDSLNGKICLNDCHLRGGEKWVSYLKHKDSIGDGNLFFYEDRGDKDSIMKKQLEKFSTEDWKKSLENFWYPGVVQYYKVKKRSRYDRNENLAEAIKKFFIERTAYVDFYQKGPCRSDDCYYNIWLELIKNLTADEIMEQKEWVKKFFPEKYHELLDKIVEEKR